MSTINFIIDEKTVSFLTKNKAWLETYIPEATKRLKDQGFEVVFDQTAGFDLIHIHMPLLAAHNLLKNCNGRRNVPIVYHGHATEDSFSVGGGTKFLVRKWFRKIAGRSDLIICPSRSAEEYYRTLLPDHDIVQLNYGINLDKYSFSEISRRAFREKYSIRENEMVVSCVAGISKRKGIMEFIEIARRYPDLKFVWVGGKYTQHPVIDVFYKVFARSGNVNIEEVPDNVLFTGYTRDVPGALSASDIFFFPSKQETQGLALVEAAACARPIVTRTIPVFQEWLTHGKDCLMGTSIDEFDTCFQQLIDDPDLKGRLGAQALRSAQAHHDIKTTTARLGTIYDGLIAQV